MKLVAKRFDDPWRYDVGDMIRFNLYENSESRRGVELVVLYFLGPSVIRRPFSSLNFRGL